MMVGMTTTTSSSSTTIIAFNKPPSIICGGFIDMDGIWNNGFACPIQNLVQYLCCETDHVHYCCLPDRYIAEINPSHEPVYISSQYQPSNHILVDQSTRRALINTSHMIDKQFEQFQKFFLPMFLLTSSVLFLVGIAIWFWLYKHKAFYAMEQDDLNEQNRVIRRPSQAIRNNSLTKQRESINLTMEQQSRRMLHPATEV